MQLYVSSLLFAPTTSDTRQIFGQGLQRYFNLVPRVQEKWGAERLQLEGHERGIAALVFSPEGNVLISSASDNTVKLWETATSEQKLSLDGIDFTGCLAVSADGNTVAVGEADHTVRLWDLMTGEEFQTLRGHDASISVLAFSPDAKTLGSASVDNTVMLWDLTTAKRKRTIKYENRVSAIDFFAGEIKVVSRSDKTVTLWDLATSEQSRNFDHDSSIRTVAVSSGSKVIAVASSDYYFRLWDTATGRETSKLQGHDSISSTTVAFSADSKMVAAGFVDGAVRVWDIETGILRQELIGHTRDISAIAFSPDGRSIASGSIDSSIRLWDVVGERERHDLWELQRGVCAVALSADGKLITSGSDDGTVRLWDTATGLQMLQLEKVEEFDEPIQVIAFGRDGKTVLGHPRHPDEIRLWDTATGKLKHRQKLEKHKLECIGAICAIALSPDGKTVAGCIENTIVTWDVATGDHIWGFRTWSKVHKIAFSDDGNTLQTNIGQLSLGQGLESPSPPAATQPPVVYLDNFESPWIKFRGDDFLWLPQEYRGEHHDNSESLLAIGQASGAISIISFK